MTNIILYSIFVGFSFSFWPIIARLTNIPSVWTAILVNGATLLTATVYFFLKSSSVTVTPKMVWVGLAIGVINGLGFLTYTYLLSTSTISASSVVTTITILIPVISTILGLIFLKEGISLYKFYGIILACIGVYLIIKK